MVPCELIKLFVMEALPTQDELDGGEATVHKVTKVNVFSEENKIEIGFNYNDLTFTIIIDDYTKSSWILEKLAKMIEIL